MINLDFSRALLCSSSYSQVMPLFQLPKMQSGEECHLNGWRSGRSRYIWPDAVIKLIYSPQGLGARRHTHIASGGLLDMLAPPVHHHPAALQVFGAVVGGPDIVAVDMCQRRFNYIGIKPLFVECGAGQSPQAVRYQHILKAHALKGHIGSLGIGVFGGVPISREDMLAVATQGPHNLQ